MHASLAQSNPLCFKDYGITMTVYCLNGYIANKNGHYRPTVSYKIQSVRDR